MSRRRSWGWLIAGLIVIAALVGAFFAAEWLVRGAVRESVEQSVVSAGVELSEPIELAIPGSVVLQSLGGTIGEAHASTRDASYDGISADVELTVSGLDVWERTAESAEASVSFDADALRALLERADGTGAFEALSGVTVEIAEPVVSLSGELGVFGIGAPLELTLRPGAEDGELLLSPESFAVGDLQVSRDDIDRLPFDLPSAITQPISVCLDDSLPQGIGLRDVEVAGARLVVDFSLDGALLADPSLAAPGSCA